MNFPDLALFTRRFSRAHWTPWVCALALFAAYPQQFSYAAKGKPSVQADQRKHELSDLHERVENAQRDVTSSEQTRAEAADALRRSEQAISIANQRLLKLEAQQGVVEEQLAALAAQAKALNVSLAEQRAGMEKLMLQQYLGGEHEPFKLLLSGKDPQTVARLLQYYGFIVRARADLLRTLAASLEQNRQLSEQSDAKHKELAAIQRDAKIEREKLVKQRQDRAYALQRLSVQTTHKKQELKALLEDQKRLTKLVERLARKATAFSAPPSGQLASQNTAPIGDRTSEFGRLKGTLTLPVRGELVHRFGSPRPDGGTQWKGLFIKCDQGQEVHAVADGRVVFADWLRGFGNLLIIDHGAGYMSLYGNNAALVALVGDTVRAGDRIAQAGSSGGNVDSGVYFELRNQGKTFDPLPWMAK